MRPSATFPPYYCPPGVDLPRHAGWHGLVGPAQVVPDYSPDGLPGFYWGGAPYDALTKGLWQLTRAGWYVLLMDREPAHLARYTLIEGPTIEGVEPDQHWLVPQLLRWHLKAGFVSAVPEVFKDYEWAPPASFRPLMERLRACMLLGATELVPMVSDEECVQLAIDLLAVNYHISKHELTLRGWLHTEMVLRIIAGAGGRLELDRLRAELHAGDEHG